MSCSGLEKSFTGSQKMILSVGKQLCADQLLTVQAVPSVFLDERQASVVTRSLGNGDHQGRKLPDC